MLERMKKYLLILFLFASTVLSAQTTTSAGFGLDPSDAKAVADMVLSKFHKVKGGEVIISPVGATIGCHLGPGGVVLNFWGKPREPKVEL